MRRRPGRGGVTFGEGSAESRDVPGFGRRGSLAGAAAVAVILGGFLWAAVAANVPPAQHPMVFGGAVVLEDQRPLTVVDLATGQATIRLQGVYTQVGAAGYGDVEAAALDNGTLLLDRRTGTFNLLAQDEYLVDTAGPGVGLGNLAGSTGAGAFADGRSAYIVRYGPTGTVSLVDESTVRQGAQIESSLPAAFKNARAVTPKGFDALRGPVSDRPGSVSVNRSTGDLWALVGQGTRCEVVQLHPSARSRTGLVATTRMSLRAGCGHAAIGIDGGTVGVVSPGSIRVFRLGSPGDGLTRRMDGTAHASQFIPVAGGSGGLRFLAHSSSGWSLTGVRTAGWSPMVEQPLRRLGAGSLPAPPVMSGGTIYTLDETSAGQPTLWAIDAATGAMSPVPGQPAYPAKGPTEKASFIGAQVIAEGPRVVFNNPGSLLAVVVFTDGSRRPSVVDKSEAVTVSASGPADLGLTPAGGSPTPEGTGTVVNKAVPVVQPVSQQVTCATTTQKPYAPQISSVSVSSGSALVSWSYELLDQTDCEPDSWSVKVTALSTPHQPDTPVQTVNGQNQLMFTGLRPATTYAATVTAYINKQSTTSSAVTFTTTPRGPDAPTSVTTTSDGKGDWVVSWVPCSAADCYVAADTWNVVGTACGAYYVGQPPVVQVPGAQDSVTIDADTLGLLGDSLTFSVQGSLASGLTGTPTPDGTCTEAWRPADPSVITLNRSSTQQGQTATVTLQVATSVPAVEAFGSRSTQFIYKVGGQTVGPISSATATVSGLTPGVAYTPTVTIYPTDHPEAAVTVAGQPLTPTLQWPAGMSVAVQGTVDPSSPNQGQLTLSFSGVPPGPMQASGTFTCGSTQSPPFGGMLTGNTLQVAIDLVDFGGQCNLTVAVSDRDTATYGGTSSPPMSSAFSIGSQPTYTFSAAVPQSCQQSICAPQKIDVLYGGSNPIDKGGDWVIKTASTGTAGTSALDPCATTMSLASPAFPVTVTLPDLCLDARKVDVTVSYKYLGTVTTVDAGTPTGTPAQPPPTTTPPGPPSTTAARAAPLQAGATVTPASAGTVVAATAGNGSMSIAAVPILLPIAGLVRGRWNRTKKRASP